ncbi:ATP-binding protein [Streptomyces sp. NPDC052236]|uniref:ATP-binding protein n=1 Tax=Streptomyces sp. NPDC052236 TaxID=3365686 RepID=UPI0037D0B2A1
MATPAIAQEAAWIVLDAHCWEEKMIDPALVLVDELVVYACRFTGSGERIHLGLCQAEDALQVTVFDTHAAHTHAGLAAACDERRETALAGVLDLVQAHLGTWGFGAAYPPSTGTCTWATLPHSPGSRAT